MRAAGAPSTRAIGGTSIGASIETPMNSVAAPMPIASSRVPVDRLWTNRPTSISATATAIVSERRVRPVARERDGGSSAPSRTAAIGGTRVARIAGRSAASTVIPIADEQRDDDRSRREHRAGVAGG